jgi:hypothetical protein
MTTEPIEIPLDSDSEKEEQVENDEEVINELKCNINQLSDKQYKQIVKDLQAGRKYKYFKLKELVKGGFKLEKVKPPTKMQTISQRSKNSNSVSTDKIYLTNEQMLIENMRELTKEVERLRFKNQKRKRENKELYDMYYVDESEDDEPQISHESQIPQQFQTSHESQIPQEEEKPKSKPIHWRSRIKSFK